MNWAVDPAVYWEDVRAPMLRVGDVTPAGTITELDYFGSIGVTLTLDTGQSFHRGIDALVSRQVPAGTPVTLNFPGCPPIKGVGPVIEGIES